MDYGAWPRDSQGLLSLSGFSRQQSITADTEGGGAALCSVAGGVIGAATCQAASLRCTKGE